MLHIQTELIKIISIQDLYILKIKKRCWFITYWKTVLKSRSKDEIIELRELIENLQNKSTN